jgi:hypothetical protein
MPYKMNLEEESPLWRRYVDELERMDLVEQTVWMKEIDLPPDTPFGKKAFVAYTEEDFLDKLNTDKSFEEKWGSI